MVDALKGDNSHITGSASDHATDAVDDVVAQDSTMCPRPSGWDADPTDPIEASEDGEVENATVPVPPTSLRSKLWEAIGGRNQALKSKEMKEACAFYDAIRKDARGVRPDVVIDVCGGHGALGMLFVAHGVARRTLIIDRHCPKSHEALVRAWKPFLGSAAETGETSLDVVSYDERALQDALPDAIANCQGGSQACQVLVVACHACQHLASNIIDCCLAARVNFAVCPCCPKDSAGGIQDAARMLGIDFGSAMVLAEMGRLRDQCSVHLRTFDSEISPQNRVIWGSVSATGAAIVAGRSAGVEVAEQRLRWAYDRAHRRPQSEATSLAKSSNAPVLGHDGEAVTVGTLKPKVSIAFTPDKPQYEVADYESHLAAKALWVQGQLQPLVGLGLPESLLAQPGMEIRRSPPRHFRARTIVSLGEGPEGGLFRFVRGTDGHINVSAAVPLETLVQPVARSMPILARLLSSGELEAQFYHGLTCIKLHATIGRDPQQLLVCFVYGKNAVPPGEEALAGMGHSLADALTPKTEVITMSQAKGVQHCFPPGMDFVDEALTVLGRGVLRYRQPFGQFSNPNPYVAIATAEWLYECVQLAVNVGSGGAPCTDLLELYCGAGSHTVALAPLFGHVLAVEINRHLVQAANFNMSENGLDNVTVVRAPSEEFCRRVIKKRSYELRRKDGSCEIEMHFGCTIVDPPRAGLDDLTRAAVSGYDHVLYISCNPDALRNDLSELLTTHEVCRLVLLDHFPFSAHAECGVHMRKRPASNDIS